MPEPITPAMQENPSEWRDQLRGADVVIDLLQPALPMRLTRAAVAAMSERRQRFLATDGSGTTQRDLLNLTADLMGRKHPGLAPSWLAR